MSGEERRNKIINILTAADAPVSGTKLAELAQVSRQIVVSDIALLRARDVPIVSTNRGYIISETKEHLRVFKVFHEDDEVETELNAIIDMGAWVKDVFVYHKVYGVVRADLNLHSRRDIANYLEEIQGGRSSLLKNVTSGYHYHTVCAPDEHILDLVQEELTRLGFLAQLRDYEPVDFWHE